MDRCLCQDDKVLLFPCSGGSNCGQIANQVAVKLTQEGVGNIYCLAGIGAHIRGMVESTKTAERIVAIDGCEAACAKKTLENAGLAETDWICVTAEGIDKNRDFDLPSEYVELICQRTRSLLILTCRAAKKSRR